MRQLTYIKPEVLDWLITNGDRRLLSAKFPYGMMLTMRGDVVIEVDDTDWIVRIEPPTPVVAKTEM